jgi:hypothetical protein
MHTLRNFYCVERGTEFTGALPALRQRIACRPFRQLDTAMGVGGNTFRAYREWPVPPSRVYRAWAVSVSQTLNSSKLAETLKTRESFLTWHETLGNSLDAHWFKQQGGSLSFAHRYKLIDLFVKWLSSHNFGVPALTEALVLHANCALDSQTLSMLNECLSLALPISKPSMGDIHSRYTYDFCQDLIGEFASHHGGTRLLFDYFAWRPGGGG